MLKIGVNANFIFLLAILISQSQRSTSQDAETQLVNALVSGIAGKDTKLISSQTKNTNVVDPSSDTLSAEEANTITVIMNTLLPSMFGLFSNITSEDYKANFNEPCRFETLMDLFKQLPPYFDIIAQKYPNQPDLIAYYSMQLASTFLVNNGSLTMECMYNMLSLQTRLNSFSLDIMDNPEKNPKLVGLFGIFMKPIMKMLKKNAMMKIIEHVDKYDKNDDRGNVNLFHFLNFFYITFGCIGILSNMLLILLLRRSSIAIKNEPKPKRKEKLNIAEYENTLPLIHHTHSLKLNRNLKGSHVLMDNTSLTIDRRHASKTNKLQHHAQLSTLRKKTMTALEKKEAKLVRDYKANKAYNHQLYYYIRRRYKTRICFVLIAICHSMYILINFIIMSQASLAAVSLKGLSQFNMACKIAFFLFPPTTAYNILHQLAMWLLVYAIHKHGQKLRRTRTFDPDADADADLIKSNSTLCMVNVPHDFRNAPNIYDESSGDEDTVSVSLTNNSNNNMLLKSNSTGPVILEKSNQLIKKPSMSHQLPQNRINLSRSIPYTITTQQRSHTSPKPKSSHSIFSRKRSNVLFCIILFFLLFAYNSHNLFLYSLAQLQGKTSIVYFCAFTADYAEYYSLLTQLVIPLSNLCLFSVLPLAFCSAQILFDVCFLLRVKREQMKRYEKLKEVIEWPLYAYFAVTVFAQAPFALHQIVDLCIGTTKFPFVFPLFIQMKFTSKIWLTVFEMSSMFFACAADFYIWILCDKQMKSLAANWINKRLFCRTYQQKKRLAEKKQNETSSPSSNSAQNSRSSEVDSGSTSSSFSSSNRSVSLKKSKLPRYNEPRTNNIYNTKSQRIEHEEHIQSGPVQIIANSYATSVVSSASNLLANRIYNKNPADAAAETAKASAAISASMAQPSIYDNFNNTNNKASLILLTKNTSPTYSSDTKLSISPTNNTSMPATQIKMIDTDIDDIDDIDLDVSLNNQAKLYEEKDLDMQHPPPSFNTVVRITNKAEGKTNI